MHIRFTEVDDQFIKSQAQNGFYTNETELVRDAVGCMREERDREERFKNAVAQGLQATMREESTPLTKDLLEELKERAIQKARDNKPYNTSHAPPRRLNLRSPSLRREIWKISRNIPMHNMDNAKSIRL